MIKCKAPRILGQPEKPCDSRENVKYEVLQGDKSLGAVCPSHIHEVMESDSSLKHCFVESTNQRFK